MTCEVGCCWPGVPGAVPDLSPLLPPRFALPRHPDRACRDTNSVDEHCSRPPRDVSARWTQSKKRP